MESQLPISLPSQSRQAAVLNLVLAGINKFLVKTGHQNNDVCHENESLGLSLEMENINAHIHSLMIVLVCPWLNRFSDFF